MTDTGDILARLEEVIAARKGADPSKSYVASLFNRGKFKIAQKVGEEAVETAMAAAKNDNGELTKEAADLLFHLLILLASENLSIDDVAMELAKREGISGLDEKASRPT